MKKWMIFILAVLFAFTAASCSPENKTNKATGDLPPTITIFAREYVAPYMPVNELPEGYEYIGDLSEDAASDTGLAGCKMYAVKEKNSFEDFYLYQECGTPINEDTVDTTQRQWAYVQWVVAE